MTSSVTTKIPDRFDISLSTGTAEDVNVNNNYYDQIVTMSQGVINKSFKALFGQVEDACVMYHVDERFGEIDAILDAPTIMLNGASPNSTEAYYQLRIKSGTATIKNRQPPHKQIDLQKWVLTVKTALNELTLSINPGENEDVIERKTRWMDELKEKYKGFSPGDYSASRIFVALSNAEWLGPVSSLSQCYDPNTGTFTNYNTWKSLPENSPYALSLMTLINEWATGEEQRSSSTLGVKFERNKSLIRYEDPTFTPIHVYPQVYQYIDENNLMGVMSVGDYTPEKEILTAGDFNCLAYCENVDCAWTEEQKIAQRGMPLARELPHERRLGFSGNLAQPALNGEPPINGSFVLDYRVFLVQYLLPQLQELCLATEFKVGSPGRHYDQEAEKMSFTPKYAIGKPLDYATVPLPASDTYFQFLRGVNKDGKNCYSWNRESKQLGRKGDGVDPFEYHGKWTISGIITELFYQTFFTREVEGVIGYNDYNIVANSRVDVNWNAGEDTLNVKGTITFDYSCRFASNKEMNVNLSVKEYLVQCDWSIQIKLEDPENGVMSPQVEGIEWYGENDSLPKPKDFEVRTVRTAVDTSVTDTTEGQIKTDLLATLSIGIGKIITNLQDRFDNVGKFVYPSHGQLLFTKPKFTRVGNVIAEIDYSGLNDSIDFPKVKKNALLPATVPIPFTSSFGEMLEDKSEPKLTWTVDFDYNQDKEIGRLILIGHNKTQKSLGFQSISFTLLPSSDGENKGYMLFNGTKWEKESKTIMDRLYKMKEFIWNIITQKEADDSTEIVQSTTGEVGTTDSTLLDENEKPQSQSESNNRPDESGNEKPPQPQSCPSAHPDESEKQKPANPPVARGTEQSHLVKKGGYAYRIERSWETDEQYVGLSVGVDQTTRNLEATITGYRDSSCTNKRPMFIVPQNKMITVELQGPVDKLGLYALRLQETWKSTIGTDGRLLGSAIDHKVVYLATQKSGKVEVLTWDVSDKKKENDEKKKKEKDEKKQKEIDAGLKTAAEK